jgi:hypothetical protein
MKIEDYNPCNSGLTFVKSCTSYKEAWETCHRGDWMLWIAKKLNVDLLKLTTAKALCANTVRHLMKDERSIKAVDAAILFGQGKATKEELNAAADAAYAAYAAAAADAAYAAYAAAAAAAYAAAADADAADAAAAAAEKENQLKTADICRQVLTEEVFKSLNITI